MIVKVKAYPLEVLLALRNLENCTRETYCIIINPVNKDLFFRDPRATKEFCPSQRNGEGYIFGAQLYLDKDIPEGYAILLPEKERKKFKYGDPSSRRKIIEVRN